MTINNNKLKVFAYFYLALPVLVFNFGWLRLWAALIFSALLISALFFLIRSNEYNSDDKFFIPISICVILLVLSILWVYSSGIGGFVWQRDDWHARNAVMHDLIDYEWPVIYDGSGNGLVYYIGSFLLPALIGKIFGFEMGSYALFIVSIIGMILVFLLLLSLFKDEDDNVNNVRGLLLPILMILFGGLNVIGQFIVFIKGEGSMSLDSTYGWSVYQYTPNTALLEWVFNQTIPAWIAVLLYLHERKNDNCLSFVLIVMLMLPYTPFAAVGIVPIMISDIVKFKGKYLFGISNVLAVSAILPVFGLYYMANAAMSDGDSAGFGFFVLDYKPLPYVIMVLIIFLSLEVIIYAILIYPNYKNDYLFYVIIFELLCIPLFRIGSSRNFIMRGSIPGLLILMIYIEGALLDKEYRKHRIRFAALVACLIIGSYSAFGDFIVTTRNTLNKDIPNIADSVYSMGSEYDDWFKDYMQGVSYLVDDPRQITFYRCIAK